MSASPEIIEKQKGLLTLDNPMLHLHLAIGGKQSHFIINPDEVYRLAQKTIVGFLAGVDNPDASPEQKRMAQLMRTTVRGALLMCGGMLLDAMYESKDHPRPGKKDDLIEWYSNIFALFMIRSATKGMLVLSVENGGEEFGQREPIIIDTIRPIAFPESTGRDLSGETEGTQTGKDGPCSNC